MRVFISYRRQDAAPAAGRLYDRLARLLSKRNVFFDVTTVAGGEDFVTSVTAAIKESDAVVVMIGRNWSEPSLGGVGRIWETGDYVRAEVRAALDEAKMVLPVLVDGAGMPGWDELPEDIRGLCTRNALPLRHERFDDDVENIVVTILGASARARPWDERGKLLVKIVYAIVGTIAALVLLTMGALAHLRLFSRPLSASIGDPATTLLLISGAIAGAWCGLAYEAGRRRRR